jgi:branched-chain amino acid transport system substrate-binding protein
MERKERMMLSRRTLLSAAGLASLVPLARARAAEMPGVTAKEIKIGNTNPHSGPASAYGAIANAEVAFFKMVNDKGGIGGRMINFISLDDGYSPPKTVEQTRRLVEQDGVAFIFNGLGTPTQTAVRQYLNARKVPQLFVATGADKWGDPQHFPWTMGWQPSYRTEAAIYGKYLLREKPQAKVGILYQNDDFGKDYLIGLKDGLGEAYAKMVVKEVSYETTDPTIDSQVVSLRSAGVDAVLTAATPKWAAQTIRKIADLDWKPLHLMTNVSISVGAVITPAGPEKAVGLLSGLYDKDNTDPQWASDAGMNEWRAFMAKYMPGADLNDANHVYGYGVASTLMQVLKQCGEDLSRANVMKQAASLHDLEIPTLLPGIRVNTSATNFHPIRSLQLARWSGTAWVLFGGVITA